MPSFEPSRAFVWKWSPSWATLSSVRTYSDPKGDSMEKKISTRVSEDTRKKLEAKARRERRTLSQVVRNLLEDAAALEVEGAAHGH